MNQGALSLVERWGRGLEVRLLVPHESLGFPLSINPTSVAAAVSSMYCWKKSFYPHKDSLNMLYLPSVHRGGASWDALIFISFKNSGH